MTEVFVSSRLSMARSLRGLTAAALAKSAGVSPEWLSKVESGVTPGDDLVARIASNLDLPVEFFYRDLNPLPASEEFHFRASSKLALKDENGARSLASLASELSEWMDYTYELPIPGIPDIQELVGADLHADVEMAAEALRSYWGLGVAPISNMVGLLESKGARVFSVSGGYKEIDAFSFRHASSAIVFLNPAKSAERLRFDLAHELGHLLLHGGSLSQKDTRAVEREANDFASAFLMPRAGLLGSLRGSVSLNDLPKLRDVWKASSMAIVFRLHQLRVLSDWTYRMMCQDLSKRGFRRGEPGSMLSAEASSLWTQILADLRDQGQSFPHLAKLIGVRPSDVRSLLVGLVPLSIDGGASTPKRSTGDLRLL